MVSVYLQRGSDKTQAKINDTMPHTWIVWVYAQSVHSHIATQEMSVIRSSFCFVKLSDFFVRTMKTLSNMSAILSE